VIDRADLDARQVETATDVLRFIPGFSVVASGGRGALTSIFPRGGESDYTLVLVDGIWLNSFGGGYDFAHLGTAGIDRIEVVRGPQSAVFGSGAIGGVVNIISRKGGPPHFDGLMEAGGQGTAKFVAAANGSHGAWSWGGAMNAEFRGDTSFRSSMANVSNDDYERVVGTAGVSGRCRRVARALTDSAATNGQPDPRTDPAVLGSTRFRAVSTSRAHRGVGDFRRRSRRHGAVHPVHTPSLFISQLATRRSHQASPAATRQISNAAGRATRPGSNSSGNARTTPRHRIPVRTGRSTDDCRSLRRTGGICPARRSRPACAAIGFNETRPGELSPFGPRPAFDEDVVWSANPKISAVWYLRGDRSSDARTGWTKIRGGAGTGIKPPTVFEIAFTDNPSLRPERSRSADFGVEHAFPGGLVAADATVFGNHYDDLIVAVSPAWSGASQYRTDNIANARAKGLELGVRLMTKYGLSGGILADTKILSVDNFLGSCSFYRSATLIRRPRHQGS
jgi:outer membrane receptor protein involved in Fe transport